MTSHNFEVVCASINVDYIVERYHVNDHGRNP